MLDRDRNLKLLELYNSLNLAKKNYFKPIPKSYSLIRPGDLIQFKYDLSEEGDNSFYTRFCLVVRNQTGKVGYTSLRGNELLSCYRLNDATPVILRQLIQSLYGRTDLCSYDFIQKGLTWLLGVSRYHTYMFRRMNNLEKISFDVRTIKIEELED
jgi:hypothetical protein